MIPYTTADFKKYVYAKCAYRIHRIEEIIEAPHGANGFDPEVTNDLGYQFAGVYEDLWRAAFIDDDDQAKAWQALFDEELELLRAGQDLTEQLPEAWWWAFPEEITEEMRKARGTASAYSDGRPVTTTCRFGDGKYDYVTHVWHPDPLHPDNRPGAEILFSVGPYPFRFGRLIVTAPGFIVVAPGEDVVGKAREEDDLFGDDE